MLYSSKKIISCWLSAYNTYVNSNTWPTPPDIVSVCWLLLLISVLTSGLCPVLDVLFLLCRLSLVRPLPGLTCHSTDTPLTCPELSLPIAPLLTCTCPYLSCSFLICSCPPQKKNYWFCLWAKVSLIWPILSPKPGQIRTGFGFAAHNPWYDLHLLIHNDTCPILAHPWHFHSPHFPPPCLPAALACTCPCLSRSDLACYCPEPDFSSSKLNWHSYDLSSSWGLSCHWPDLTHSICLCCS